jgi:predicted secreted protein
MNYFITLGFIVMLFGCAETKQTQTNTETQVEAEKSTGQIILNPLMASDYGMQINQTAMLSMSEHGSVGITSDIVIQDETILTLVSDEFTYTKEPKEGTTGGDGGSRTYIFKALKTGQTTITAKEYFRGNLEKEVIYNITVQ